MNAGRELDALVAEKVMGWKFNVPPPTNDYFCLEAQTVYGDKHHPVWVKTNDGYQCGLCNSIPSYSTSIADAWRVVEKMAQDGWDYSVEYKGKGRSYEFTAEGYFCRWVEGRHEQWHTVAGTVQLHICLAALKAVGHAVD